MLNNIVIPKKMKLKEPRELLLNKTLEFSKIFMDMCNHKIDVNDEYIKVIKVPINKRYSQLDSKYEYIQLNYINNIDFFYIYYIFFANNDYLYMKIYDSKIYIYLNESRISKHIDISILENLFYKSKNVIYEESLGYASYVYLKDTRIQAYGQSFNALDAKRSALYEYLERYTASNMSGNDIVCMNLKEIYESNYKIVNIPGFETNIIDLEKKIPWISVKSILDNSYTKLIPQEFVYYLDNKISKNLYESTSNGSALGGSLIHAQMNGLYECLERDFFIRFWNGEYTNIYCVAYDLPNSVILKNNYCNSLGYDALYYCINIGTINVIWCLLVNKNNNESMYSVSGFSCNLDLEKSMNKAFSEAIGTLLYNKKKSGKFIIYNDNFRENSIESPLDHIFYYSRKKNVGVILQNINEISIESSFLGFISLKFSDINDEFKHLINEVKNNYKNVFYYDQTDVTYLSTGLHSVKVIIEGGYQPTFNNKNTSKFVEYPYSDISPLG